MLCGINLDWGREKKQVAKALGEWGGNTVFDVNTGHLAQDKATVYVFLSLTCRGGFPVIVFLVVVRGGRTGRILCLSNPSPPSAHPPPSLPFPSFKAYSS